MFLWVTAAYGQEPDTQNLTIFHKNNTLLALTADIADSREERMKGLMFQRILAKNHAMLFVYPHEQIIYMWMKHTYIPLDMLFLDKDYTIVHIAANNQPHDETPVSSVRPAQYVLEINAGMAESYGINVGDIVVLH